jgi:GNAT superfamily N-acetyltransferase
MNDITTRWIDGPTASQEDWDAIEEMLASRGWMSLNRATSRILVKEEAGQIIGFHVFQLVPFCGPLYVRPEYRGTTIAGELADEMLTFLTDAKARGWITTAANRHSEKLCEARGMKRLDEPVYVMGDPGGLEVE